MSKKSFVYFLMPGCDMNVFFWFTVVVQY